MKSGQGRGEGVNHSESGRGASGRQKEETTRGRSAPGQMIILSLPPQADEATDLLSLS